MLFRITVAIAVVGMTVVGASADPQRENLQIFKDIQKQINHYGYFTVFDNVEVGIDDAGLVTLKGSVTNPFKRKRIEERVAEVDGVMTIDNQIETLPVSPFDDRLRYQVARAIYGHPSFSHYRRAYSSIHIIVNRGHVTLAGVVNNEHDEQIALMRAGQVGAFSVSSELRTSAEAEAELEQL